MKLDYGEGQLPRGAGPYNPEKRQAAEIFFVCGYRKTGMSIVSHQRMPLAADGQEQMDPFFAQGPASIPPVQRLKRVQAVNEIYNAEGQSDAGEVEEDEDEEGQTANYGKHATSTHVRSRKSKASLDHALSEGGEQDPQDADVDDDIDESAAPTPRALQNGHRQSNATSSAASFSYDHHDSDEDQDGGGTQTMDLEGSQL